MSAVAAVAAAAPGLPGPTGFGDPKPVDGAAVGAGVLTGTLEFAHVLGDGQDVVHTASRRAEPRAWLRAVVWLVGSGLHPKANATTLALAKDLVSRMDYRRGIVLYDMRGTARRLGVNESTVRRHAAVLRELGALVWLVHGSKRNLRLPGRKYAGTATVYGAVIPPVYDAAMGHRLSGAGYEARISGVTEAGRELAVAAAREAAGPVDNPAPETVDNSRPDGRAPHSRGRSTIGEKAELVPGCNNTSRERASRSTASTSPSNPKSSSEGGGRRSVRQVARDIAIARQVRPLVNWTQSEGLRRLGFALRPLIDQGLGAHDIAAELHSWYLNWRPARPAAYISAELARRAVRAAELADAAAGADPLDNQEWRAWCEQRQQAAAVWESVVAAAVRTDEDRRAARAAALINPQLVIDHLDDDENDAIDLYGIELAAQCTGLNASSNVRLEVAW